MIQAKLPRDDMPEEEWSENDRRVQETGLEDPAQPLSKRRILARLEMAKNGAEPGSSRTRNSLRHLKALQWRTRKSEPLHEVGSNADAGESKQS